VQCNKGFEKRHVSLTREGNKSSASCVAHKCEQAGLLASAINPAFTFMKKNKVTKIGRNGSCEWIALAACMCADRLGLPACLIYEAGAGLRTSGLTNTYIYYHITVRLEKNLTATRRQRLNDLTDCLILTAIDLTLR
jgi:hypothetical protein